MSEHPFQYCLPQANSTIPLHRALRRGLSFSFHAHEPSHMFPAAMQGDPGAARSRAKQQSSRPIKVTCRRALSKLLSHARDEDRRRQHFTFSTHQHLRNTYSETQYKAQSQQGHHGILLHVWNPQYATGLTKRITTS